MHSRCRKLRDRITGTFVAKLRESHFYQQDFNSTLDKCLRALGDRKIEQIICYGLGTFSNGVDVVSRYQLALLLLIYERLKELETPLNNTIEVFDPSFEDLDKAVLLSFNSPQFKVIQENEHCGRRLDCLEQSRCALIYMPHLDKYLYNNLLGVNWDIENLSRFVILGNSFHEMIDNETLFKRESELHYMNQLACNFAETRVVAKRPKNKQRKAIQRDSNDEACYALLEFEIDDNSFEHSDVFNNLAFHIINVDWLEKNSAKIQQHRLRDWKCVDSNQMVSEWSE